MVRLCRLLLLAVAVALLAAGSARSRPASPADLPPVELRVEVESRGRPPYPQEMVLIHVHGRYRVPVTLEKMATPAMEDLRVIKLGPDHWFNVMENGLTVRAFERIYAVFPQRSGRLTVPSFVHRITVLDKAMKHQEIEVASAPVPVEVAPAPSVAGDWWLPAADLSIAETWSAAPEQLPIGRSTRRTLVIRANGVFDDQLPPPPAMRADGLIVFPGETRRWTKVGLGRPADKPLPLRERSLRRPELYDVVDAAPLGPVSEVTYTFDIRPATDRPVTLPEIRIPWFDIGAGRMREIVLPERIVALALLGTDVEALERDLGIVGGAPAPAPDPLAPVLAGLAAAGAFVAGIAAVLGALAPDLPARWRRALAGALDRRRRLARARGHARRGEAALLREALVALGPAEGDGGTGPRGAVARLDRHLYGGAARPDLVALLREAVTEVPSPSASRASSRPPSPAPR